MAVQSRPFRSFGQAQRRTNKGGTKGAGMLVTLAIVAALMSILYLAQTGRVATQGYRLEQLDLQRAELIRVNQQLMFEIEQAQVLDNIQQRALALGFQSMNPGQARYITIEINPQRWTAMR